MPYYPNYNLLGNFKAIIQENRTTPTQKYLTLFYSPLLVITPQKESKTQ